MCYYALGIYAACGHAVGSAKPIEGLSGCPYRRKAMADRQFLRTPSLTSSISTQASPRTTVGSVESLPVSKHETDTPETPCATRMWHPLHIHRFPGLCDTCQTQACGRLSDLELSIAESQSALIQRARRDKVRIEGRQPRQLELVHRREMAKVEKAEKDAEAVKDEPQRPSSPLSIMKESAPSSTFSYMRGLWGLPTAPKPTHSPHDSESQGLTGVDDGVKKLDTGPLSIAPEGATRIAGEEDQASG